MSDEAVNNAGRHIWAYRLAFLWCFLFSANALGAAMIAALTGAEWSALTTQKKIMIGVAIMVNWTGTMMAFVSKAAKRADPAIELGTGGAAPGGTGIWTAAPPPVISKQ